MRIMPVDINDKLMQKILVRDNNSDIRGSFWINRPTTELTESTFLERQTILTGTFTDTSVAVSHPSFGLDIESTYVGYIQAGKLRVVKSTPQIKMENHIWLDTGFLQDADSVAVAFDGTMPQKPGTDTSEFLTEDEPWVFWTKSGIGYGMKLSDSTPVILVESNCTDVSAVRALWTEDPTNDFGLVVFFVVNGMLYYRQLIDSQWTDAELVSFAISGKTVLEVSASRTWDYRVVVQLKIQGEGVLQLYTQFMGIAKNISENISINQLDIDGELIPINEIDYPMYENIEVTDLVTEGILASIDVIPSIIKAYNVDDGSGDWGRKAIFVFDEVLDTDTVLTNIDRFQIVDSINITYIPHSIDVGSDRKTLTLHFANFNNAYGVCEARYIPGTVISYYGNALVETDLTFYPENLVPVILPVPEVEDIWNE